jgi:molybdate transport system substrate-binding protein
LMPHYDKHRSLSIGKLPKSGEGMRRWLTLVLAAVVLGALAPARQLFGQSSNREVVVAAAVSLKESFGDIGRVYERETGVKVAFSFGASGELARQIEVGAPVDVFASAGEREMDELQAKHLVDERTDFARNALVLVVPAIARSRSRLHSFSDLAQADVQRIALGNPQTVPAGRYAEQLLRNLQLWEKIKGRLVLAENVRQVLDYVGRGEADAGIVYATDVAVAHGRVSVAAKAPDRKYGPVLYPLAVVKEGRNREAARRFTATVLGPEGQKILSNHGFLAAR